MSNKSLELKFDPKTIEHLGVKMYATLPPALAELISNAYDADASEISIEFTEINGTPKSITVRDNGTGMDYNDVQGKFLVIGRNRRQEEGDKPSPNYKRLPTGKKGLGKLALFGLANTITVDTVKAKKRNRFTLNWENLLSAQGTYNPTIDKLDQHSLIKSGTTIKLSDLKRKSLFDLESIADSLSKIFIVDTNFSITLKKTDSDTVVKIDNLRRYKSINKEFEWHNADLSAKTPQHQEYLEKAKIHLITSETPIPPNSGLRGVTIFSRGKMVNSPEYFSDSASSHFYQYLTGRIEADFIDLLDEDVISTNRQSINWENPEMAEFRLFLTSVISTANSSWRTQRKDKKNKSFTATTGIDKEKWFSTLPENIKKSANNIIETISSDEGISESYTPIIKALHAIIPEYPMLHWRHLNSHLKDRVQKYYESDDFGMAADQATKMYAELLRSISSSPADGTKLADVFSGDTPSIVIADTGNVSGKNMQEGQGHLTRGLMAGFRNPVNHSPMDSVVPSVFTELDCLNILSLVSYLITRVDKRLTPPPAP